MRVVIQSMRVMAYLVSKLSLIMGLHRLTFLEIEPSLLNLFYYLNVKQESLVEMIRSYLYMQFNYQLHD
ncbi:hypothetical protein DK880_00166 [Candidatus Cardinium hertigii]|uniref:Uncharacterized protein n=1 Tax=Candidatus Cardinium hertigii TaxID=247481 RepID=A0A2Z3LB69_9BACT|nr:hypothetical protein DK880_00166 [Candidatus Cardinium hertigii]